MAVSSRKGTVDSRIAILVILAALCGVFAQGARASFLDKYTLGVSAHGGIFESNLSSAFVAEGGFYKELSLNVIHKDTDRGLLLSPYFTTHSSDPVTYQELGLKIGLGGSSWEEESKYALSFGLRIGQLRINPVEFKDPYDIGDKNESFVIEEQTVVVGGFYYEMFGLFRHSDHFGVSLSMDYRYIPIDGHYESFGVVTAEAPNEELFEFKMGLGIIAVY